MIINLLSLLLTIVGVIYMIKDKEQQHQWYMYLVAIIIGFFTWKAALHSLWFIITIPFKLIKLLGGLL